jgi:CubicO group peptidase (beta-lactamase class C family)
MSDPLEVVSSWPGSSAAAWRDATRESRVGVAGRTFRWASVTKVISAMALWVAVEEGTVSFDDEVGPPGATLRHLLSHASGVAPDDDRILAPPATRRIYSNRGIELAADHLARRAAVPFADYLREAVIEPLGMAHTRLAGSPAHGAEGTLDDLMALGSELLEPRLVSAGTHLDATKVSFEGLPGVLPGFGFQPRNDWGLGVEVRGDKAPHWTGRTNSASTFGHFGRSGAFIWVDPVAGVTLGGLSDQQFGPWAVSAWPDLSDRVLEALR